METLVKRDRAGGTKSCGHGRCFDLHVGTLNPFFFCQAQIVPHARKLADVNFDEMLEMGGAVSRVLASRSVASPPEITTSPPPSRVNPSP